jgi:hypothetical protein
MFPLPTYNYPIGLSNGDESYTIQLYIQGDHKVSTPLMITIHNVTSNVKSVPRQSPDIY